MADTKAILKQIMDMLHIDVIGKKIEYRHNMIREKWTTTKYVAESYEDCHRYLTKYYQYHLASIQNGVVMPEEMAYAYVREILDKQEGGYGGSIKNAIRGRHGGMIALIDIIAEELKKKDIEQYVTYVFGHKINPIDYGLKVALMREYLNTYGKYIMQGEHIMCAEELALNLERVIKFHVEIVNRYRNILQ